MRKLFWNLFPYGLSDECKMTIKVINTKPMVLITPYNYTSSDYNIKGIKFNIDIAKNTISIESGGNFLFTKKEKYFIYKALKYRHLKEARIKYLDKISGMD